jgi:hypothetical protein
MTAKKQKEKERRRARKLAEEAWNAVNDENLQLAEKIIRRAVATQPENPVLWNDQGMILFLMQKETEAEESFRTALSLAPDFAAVYAQLAMLAVRQGYLNRAVALQKQAVKYAPDNVEFADRLAAYESLAGQPTSSSEQAPPTPEAKPAGPPFSDSVLRDWQQRAAALDWPRLDAELTRDGYALIPSLLDAQTCAALRLMFDDDSLFAKTVVMEREEFGNGVYRYFRAPLPVVVNGVRRAIYRHISGIANHWHQLLDKPERFPPDWEDFRRECAEAGQTTPTPILLKYGPGGFNALHRDLRGRVFFPIQMAVVLSPKASSADPACEGFQGGEFLLCDVPEGKKSHRREIPAGLGDALLFCTRDRLVPIGGVQGLQPVKHGVARITGTRFVLGIPFHEYR